MQVAPTASRMRDIHGYTLICLLYMDMHGYTNIGKHTVKVCKHVKTSWDICKHHLYSNIIKYHQISSKFIISVQLDKGPEAQEVACLARFLRGFFVLEALWLSPGWVSSPTLELLIYIIIYHHISWYVCLYLHVLAVFLHIIEHKWIWLIRTASIWKEQNKWKNRNVYCIMHVLNHYNALQCHICPSPSAQSPKVGDTSASECCPGARLPLSWAVHIWVRECNPIILYTWMRNIS